jgi:hypothetical protein
MEEATRRALLFFAVPLWLTAGLADWYMHRRTRIEQTAGWRESILHAMMLAEAGVPALLGLFAEVNAGVLLTSYVALLAHQATAIWDVVFTDTRRRILPAEQHIHSFLEVGPMMAVTLLSVLHWDQLRALFGGPGAPDFSLRPKQTPLRREYVLSLLVALVTCGAVPYGEELLRCWRAARQSV